MKKVLVLYEEEQFYWNWLQPLWWCSREFRVRGVRILFAPFMRFRLFRTFISRGGVSPESIHHDLSFFASKISGNQYDIIMCSFHYNDGFFKLSIEEQNQVFKYLREHCKKLVWLDPSDSTGTCSFQVMPFVDLYLKKQLLKDKRLYLKNHYGQRIYSDYYYRKLGLETEKDTVVSFQALKSEHIKKLGVSWNVGIGKIGFNNSKRVNRITSLLGIKDNVEKKTIQICKRRYRLFFDGAYKEDGALLHQRKMTHTLIEQLHRDDCVSPQNRFDRRKYLQYMKDTMLNISPFGYGEICFRDFEAYNFGGCLVKPSMEHIETYPDYYKPYKTYIPIDWDFSGFFNIFELLDSDEGLDKVQEIASNGKLFYKSQSLSTKEGRMRFVEHILDTLQIYE